MSGLLPLPRAGPGLCEAGPAVSPQCGWSPACVTAALERTDPAYNPLNTGLHWASLPLLIQLRRSSSIANPDNIICRLLSGDDREGRQLLGNVELTLTADGWLVSHSAVRSIGHSSSLTAAVSL